MIAMPVGRLLAALLLVSTAVACDDPYREVATLPTLSDTATVYAINGAPAGAPTGLQLFNVNPVPANSAFAFDVAFDLDAQGRPVLIPVILLSGGRGSTQRVGLQVVSGTYEGLTLAPRNGYRYDSTLVVTPGQVVAVEVTEANCAFSLTSNVIYGKLTVLAVDLPRRRYSIAYTVDRNCGYRSFLPGIPTE
jgi:hypothetical protein